MELISHMPWPGVLKLFNQGNKPYPQDIKKDISKTGGKKEEIVQKLRNSIETEKGLTNQMSGSSPIPRRIWWTNYHWVVVLRFLLQTNSIVCCWSGAARTPLSSGCHRWIQEDVQWHVWRWEKTRLLITDLNMFNLQLTTPPRRRYCVFIARHPVYGWVSLAEPKQDITWLHGKDTRTLGFVPKTLGETC